MLKIISKSMLNLAVGTAALLLTGSAYAACMSIGCTGVYVERLYTYVSGQILIGTSGDETLMSCEAAEGKYATLNHSEPAADIIYSTLLAAQMANKRVYIRTDEKSKGCKIVYVTLDKQ
ncbi:hypothetical protein HQQ94_11330 [Shewanella sp. VB17]|uniref:hypothetical protein n=1 Tax=Shewanella sp. VB17 TaxID=2739432 RepID=UPI001564627C|nr:hypothetical protein [Shewanella sp. VB17]NRD73819.1 hypothetical protein [Shewanella sp. VB17]